MQRAVGRRVPSCLSSLPNRYLNTVLEKPPVLAYELVPAKSPEVHDRKTSNDDPVIRTALVLHGLLGSGRNWRTATRLLQDRLTSLRGLNPEHSVRWQFVLVDLRNHGLSAEQGFHAPHNMMSAARDIEELILAEGWQRAHAVIGHSMGGKVALQYALNTLRGVNGHGITPPEQVWVLDSVPSNMEHRTGDVERVLEALQHLPQRLPSRRWLVEEMTKNGFSSALAEWLGSNLKPASDPSLGEEMQWVFNLQGAEDMYSSYQKLDLLPHLDELGNDLQVNIVKAARSQMWPPHVIEAIRDLSIKDEQKESNLARGTRFHVLQNAGHWLHLDNPKGLVDLMAPSFATA